MADQDSNLVDWSDSFYSYVKARIAIKNSNRQFGGIVEARDWPLKQPQLEALYLLTTTLDPNRSAQSWSAPSYSERAQFVWQIKGDDITEGVISSNRGDRYRKHFQIVQEILYGMFPGYCEKQSYSVNQQSQSLVATSYDPNEFIWFTKPGFSDRIDRSSGIMFGSASFNISSFAPAVFS